MKARKRCQVTTSDQVTAQVGKEPLRTLAAFRMHPHLGGVTFGQNAVVARGAGATLRVGPVLDEVWNFRLPLASVRCPDSFCDVAEDEYNFPSNCRTNDNRSGAVRACWR